MGDVLSQKTSAKTNRATTLHAIQAESPAKAACTATAKGNYDTTGGERAAHLMISRLQQQYT